MSHVHIGNTGDDLTDYLELGEIQDFSARSRTYELASLGPMPWWEDLKKLSDHETWRDVSLGLVTFPKEDSLWRPESYHLYSDTRELELKEARTSFYTPVCVIDPLGQKTKFAYDDKFLFRTDVVDGVGNKTTTKHNYAHLKPSQIRDPNGNRTEFVYDAFNNLVGVANMGKAGENVGDSTVGAQQIMTEDVLEMFMQNPILQAKHILGNLTERRVKNNTRLYRSLASGGTLEPCYEAIIRRQEHLHSGRSADNFSISISYLDSRGEVTEQAELTSTGQNPTWCIRGRSLKDNKGEIVREYRPHLSPTHIFRSHNNYSAKAITYLLDPLGRRIVTLNPDRTWSKTIISPWQKVDFDQGDTILTDDPEQDEDVGHLFRLVPRDLYFPTWYNLQRTQAHSPMSEIAGVNATFHNTPTVSFFDALGRQISVVSDQRGLNATTSKTYNYLGNVSAHYDARNRLVQKTSEDLLQRYQVTSAMDSGGIHKVFNCLDMEVIRWTDSGIVTKTTYDTVGRLKEIKVARGSELPVVTEMYIYGEGQPQPELKNLRGNLFEVRDQSGISKNLEFDFKNNCVAKSRQLAVNYKDMLDWASRVQLESEHPFLSFMTYNATNQVICSTSPNGDITRTTFNPLGLQCRSTWQAASGGDIQVLVDNVEYNEDRKPTMLQRGNKCLSRYVYDHSTGKLTEKITVRADKTKIQHKIFLRDCFGREAHVTDLAQDVLFFRNRRVKPVSTYRYDGLGRLISATGVEQINVHSQTGKSSTQARVSTSYTLLNNPTNGQEVSEYSEAYVYDIAGNIKETTHQFAPGSGIQGWTRKFSYNEPSLLRKEDLSNQLSESAIGDSLETYRYLKQDSGALGCLQAMPGYPSLSWDFSNRLKSSSTQYQDKGTPEKTFYVYDSHGTRVRKVTERSSAMNADRTRLKETLYIDNCTIYREFKGNGRTLSLEKKTSMVDIRKGWVAIENSIVGKTPVANLIRYQIDHGLEVDAESRIILREMYSPFGMTTYAACGADITAPAVYRYSAYERDEETGLYYARSRYYAPWLGRWLSPDPKGIEDGLNRYAYVSNDPISFVDPQGTCKTFKEEGSSGQNGGQPVKTWTDTMKEKLPTPTTAVRAVAGILAVSVGKVGIKKLTDMTKTEGKKVLQESLHSFKKTILPQETFVRNIPYCMKLAYGQSNNPTGKVTVESEKLGGFLSTVNKIGGEMIDTGGDKAFEYAIPMDPVTSTIGALQSLHSQYGEMKAAKTNALDVGGDKTDQSKDGDEKANGPKERLSASQVVSIGLAGTWTAYNAYKSAKEAQQSVETLAENVGPAASTLHKAACLPNKFFGRNSDIKYKYQGPKLPKEPLTPREIEEMHKKLHPDTHIENAALPKEQDTIFHPQAWRVPYTLSLEEQFLAAAADGSLQKAQSKSLLFTRLPSEVRMQIWRHAMGSHKVHLTVQRGRLGQYTFETHDYKWWPQRGLLRVPLVCRAAYMESISCLYSNNTFCFGFGQASSKLALTSLDTMLPKQHIASMRHIEVGWHLYGGVSQYYDSHPQAWDISLDVPAPETETLWDKVCAELVKLSYLRTLRIVVWLSGDGRGQFVEKEKGMLAPLLVMEHLERFDIHLPWNQDDPSLWNNAPFQVSRRFKVKDMYGVSIPLLDGPANDFYWSGSAAQRRIYK
ncbi:rhs repeat-associated core domain protein [Fusarium beomiforme]|uniref:Rhs repeat-associated core domain protein n=1 Tax=Fusarium beomiforme TaxID=44412 RepID=A0A9P5DSE4_9HYPO|nr:rhs repeat-associated core domain protein [Fusarium beomiforme]